MKRWKPVPGFEGRYEVSDRGDVLSLLRTKMLKPGTNGAKGYLIVFLAPGRQKRYVHHLVAEAFLGPRPDRQIVRHLNGDNTDNAASNLEYGTPGANNLDAVRHGTHPMASKTQCKNGHKFTEENTYITPIGDRVCRTCRDARVRAWIADHPEKRAAHRAREFQARRLKRIK